MLKYGGAGVLGLSALVAGCGVPGALATSATAAGGAGSPSWWAGQKLHHVVNFGNWQYYIDVLGHQHPSLEHFTKLTEIKVNYSEPISQNLPFYAKIRPEHRAAGLPYRRFAGRVPGSAAGKAVEELLRV